MTVYGSDVIVDVLTALGIEEVAFNPGASFRGLHDSLVHRRDDGGPRVSMVLHEEIAVAAAHGYAKASGRPMAVALHNVVGLQHACMALFNAWCDRVPILAIGATGPVDAARRRPWIDWIHTANVQGSHVRDFVKWDDPPMSVPAAVEALQRGYQLATTAPSAPVYVCLPVEVQEDPVAAPPEIAPIAPVARTTLDPFTVQESANVIRGADRPVIVADRAADSPGAISALAQLARAIGAPILDRGARMNVATVDDHDLTGDERAVLAESDLILAFEVADLAGVLALAGQERSGAIKILDVGLTHQLVGSWAADYQRLVPDAVVLPADAALAATSLAEACAASDGTAASAKVASRTTAIAARHRSLRERWRTDAQRSATTTPISTAWLAHEVGEALGDRRVVLSNGTLNGWARRLWDWTEPGTHLGGNGGGGIGYGIGATVGAALAHRATGRTVVNLQPDGDLLYSSSALWTLAHAGLPVLTVVWNNGGYRNSEEHAERIARHRGRPIADAAIGNRIERPSVDFVALAGGYGMWARGPVDDPRQIRSAVKAALEVVDAGEPALVEVRAAAR